MAEYPITETTSGRVRGISEGGVNIFKGIPYAGLAEGTGRFLPPRPPIKWTGVRDTLAYGHRAMQDDNAFGLAPELLELLALREPQPMNENCLVLNVWTPALNDGVKRPVMFWCHGGAFISGSGASPWYEGGSLCRKGNVVVVTINHRLGAFGYLHLEDLGGHEYASSGNAGMLDIVAALQWVRDNIASFGGDPDNVTIFGESGGGAKISVLMAMPAARGLFHKAIMQSGPAVEMMSCDDATRTAHQVLAELGLEPRQVAQLREIPAAQLLHAQMGVLRKISSMSFANRRRVGFNPVIDGKDLPAGPFEPVAPTISADVPLMIGTNKDEMTLFFGLSPWMDQLNESALRDRVRMFVGDDGEKILEAYRRARPRDSNRDLMLAIATDAGMRIPSLITADRKVAQHAAPVFVYMFTWETPVLGGVLKSPHALEIPFVFDTVNTSTLTGDSSTRFPLADKMSRTWIQFAHSGDPNNTSIPSWPAYSLEHRPTMIFDDVCRVENDPYGEERLAWSGQ
jgi:para-nitrobenzyl esterase